MSVADSSPEHPPRISGGLAVVEEEHPKIRDIFRGTETILLADDEPMVRDLLTLALERYGYTVLVAASGQDAIDLVTRYLAPIHLVIADVVMPKVDGCQLVSDLRRWYPTIGVLLMSGYSEGERAAQNLEEDMTFFIRKPFSADEMAAAVRAALDWRPLHTPE